MIASRSARHPPGSITARDLADRAFSRAVRAPLVPDNRVRILKDAGENYPAWLDAIQCVRRTIHIESYIIHDDDAGRRFGEALAIKGAGGCVRQVDLRVGRRVRQDFFTLLAIRSEQREWKFDASTHPSWTARLDG